MRLLGYSRIGLFDNYGLGTAVSTFAIFAFALLALLCRAFAILTRCAVLTLRSFGATAPFANTLLASAPPLGAFAFPAFALLAGAGGAACSCLGSHRLGLDNLYFRSLLSVPVTACGHHESGHSHDANER